MKKIFFVDFDGTITLQDTCDYLTQTFCRDGWKEINEKWEQKKISTIECARQTLELMDATADDLYRLLDTVNIDPYFADFVRICKKNQSDIFILSDGYDFNIKYLLNKHGFSSLPFFANHMTRDNKGFFVDFPYVNNLCGQCGTCKKTLVKSLTKPNYQTVYIGDGYSDFCVSQTTDFIFAKKTLLGYCRNNQIPAIPFQDFSDIIRWATDVP